MTFPPRQNLRIFPPLFADSRPTRYNQDQMTQRSQWRCLRPPAVLAAVIEHMPDRRHKCRSERVLDHGRREERRDPDQPCLVDAELHAKREPCNPAARMTMWPSPIATKSSGTERSQPRSLSHPVIKAA